MHFYTPLLSQLESAPLLLAVGLRPMKPASKESLCKQAYTDPFTVCLRMAWLNYKLHVVMASSCDNVKLLLTSKVDKLNSVS